MNRAEVFQHIRALYKKYFEEVLFESFLEQVDKSSTEFKDYYANLIQKNNLIQLEVSLVSDKAISDFNLTKDGFVSGILPIDKITFIKSDISEDNSKMTLTIYTGRFNISYSTFSRSDTRKLSQFANEIIKRVN